MKYGILCCGHSCEDRLNERLNPWFALSKKHNFIFSAVSSKFKEYENLGINQDNTKTQELLNNYLNNKQIQHLEIPKKSLSEHESRNLALKYILDEKCDFVLLLDLSDEYYTEQQIEKIIEYIKRPDNQYYAWFKLNFKNYVFSGNEWIDGFCPPRIFKVNINNQLKLDSFFWDNDVIYKEKSGGSVDYRQLPNKEIPKNLIQITHLTWLDSNGKLKYEYQMKHFGHCGYTWNYKENKLEFNLDFHKKNNIPIPEIHQD